MRRQRRPDIEMPAARSARSEHFAQAIAAKLSCALALEKSRHELEVEGLIWQVDEYSGGLTGLVTVDVELPSE